MGKRPSARRVPRLCWPITPGSASLAAPEPGRAMCGCWQWGVRPARGWPGGRLSPLCLPVSHADLSHALASSERERDYGLSLPAAEPSPSWPTQELIPWEGPRCSPRYLPGTPPRLRGSGPRGSACPSARHRLHHSLPREPPDAQFLPGLGSRPRRQSGARIRLQQPRGAVQRLGLGNNRMPAPGAGR